MLSISAHLQNRGAGNDLYFGGFDSSYIAGQFHAVVVIHEQNDSKLMLKAVFHRRYTDHEMDPHQVSFHTNHRCMIKVRSLELL